MPTGWPPMPRWRSSGECTWRAAQTDGRLRNCGIHEAGADILLHACRMHPALDPIRGVVLDNLDGWPGPRNEVPDSVLAAIKAALQDQAGVSMPASP